MRDVKTTPFLTYLHFDPEREAEFLIIRCEGGTEITMTGSHLIFRVQGDDGKLKATPARNIKIGDCLLHVSGHDLSRRPVRVVEIELTWSKGVYAPLTRSGTMIVDGFLVSCYTPPWNRMQKFTHC
jgi:hypothetical protein